MVHYTLYMKHRINQTVTLEGQMNKKNRRAKKVDGNVVVETVETTSTQPTDEQLLASIADVGSGLSAEPEQTFEVIEPAPAQTDAPSQTEDAPQTEPATTSPEISEAGPQRFRVIRVDELGSFKANVIRPNTKEHCEAYVAALKSTKLKVVPVI